MTNKHVNPALGEVSWAPDVADFTPQQVVSGSDRLRVRPTGTEETPRLPGCRKTVSPILLGPTRDPGQNEELHQLSLCFLVVGRDDLFH